MTTISTEEYQFAHGRKPRGVGNWAFYFGRTGSFTRDPEFAPCMMSYSAACQWAKQQARQLGCEIIIVGS